MSKKNLTFDVVVIGGGPAGVTAALRARELGATVALVERGRMGGTCTNDGCVPTRVLAKAARLVRDAEQFGDYGLLGQRPVVDFPQVLARTRQIVDKIHEKKQLIARLERSDVAIYANTGEIRFLDERTVALPDHTTLEADRFIICAGGRARRLPFPGAEYALTHSDVWALNQMPRLVAVVGGAATGCQLVSVFESFGARVWLFDVAPRILAGEDEHVSRSIATAFAGRGVEVIAGIDGVERIERTEQGLQLQYRHAGQRQTLEVEAVILAVGWPGNVDTLNLAAANVQTERNYIVVDDHLRTSTPHIFAAGDITGRMMLVQSAGFEARIAAENAVLDSERPLTHRVVPHGGFTDPEYGSVGLSEQAAREQYDCAVAVVPYADLDRAVIDGRYDGFCKLIVERSSRLLLGAHVVGEQAVEVVQIVAAGMAAGMRIEQLAELELAYPTFTAIVGLAARQIVRELGVVSLAEQPCPEGTRLPHARIAEWEYSDS